MSGRMTEFMKQQKYRFDFGTDDKLYIVIFDGKIPQAELKGMVLSLQNCLYEKMSEVILLYLKQHHLTYSDFNCIELPLEQYDAMKWAGYLLHSETYGEMDGRLEGIDVFYSVMDYQKCISKEHCEGCYFALKRLSPENGEYQHSLIGQTFFSGRHSYEENGYFSIRKTKGNILCTIDSSEGRPVLPTFGCVDVMALLMDIENISSKEDAAETAMKSEPLS